MRIVVVPIPYCTSSSPSSSFAGLWRNGIKDNLLFVQNKNEDTFMEVLVLLSACCFAAIAGSTAIVEAVKEDQPHEINHKKKVNADNFGCRQC